MQAGDIRKGTKFELEGAIYKVVDFQQVKQARSASFIRTKIKNIETGAVKEHKFNPTDKVDAIEIEQVEMQYLYTDGELYYFMNMETFEQIPVNLSSVEDALNFIKEEDIVTMQFYKNRIIGVEPALFVELKITKSDPGLQGDSSRAGTKPATLETGLEIKVPLFVNEGDTVKIDTRTSEYVERI